MFGSLSGSVEVGFEGHVDRRQILQMRIFGADVKNVCKGVWIRRIIGVDHHIALIKEFLLIFKDRCLRFTELIQDQVTLSASRKFDSVYGNPRLDRRMVDGTERTRQESIK